MMRFLGLGLLSLLAVFLALGAGFGTWQSPFGLDDIAWQIRYPRVLTALIVGACLSVAGSSLQAIFDNPLADPSLIGTSGGAALGVVAVLSLGIGGLGVPLAAFCGAVLVCAFILLCHKIFGGGQMGLVILGFVISAFCGACVSLVLFMSDDMVLRSATTWLSGSMAEAGFVPFGYALACLVLGLLLLLPLGRKLDILMMGESCAVSMGVSVVRVRTLAIVSSALLTAAAVSLAGVIGFVGMIVPNILALTLGGGRTKLMMLSGWLGAIFLLVVDTVARVVTYPVDVPVGIVLALLGGPFFIWLFVHSAQKGA